jgi:hypothetical protein
MVTASSQTSSHQTCYKKITVNMIHFVRIQDSYVSDGARTIAVNALGLRGSNDDILESTATSNVEDLYQIC